MVETKNRTIDGLKISVTQWPAMKAWKNKRKLLALFGPVLAELGAGLEGNPAKKTTKKKQLTTAASILDGNFDFAKLGSAIDKLFDKLSDDDLQDLLMTFFDQNMRFDKLEMTIELFDQTFPGKMLTVYKIIGFVLEVNFGSFLGKNGIGSLLKTLKT